MIRSLFRSKFYNSVDVFSTRNLTRFASQDFPQALSYSRPFNLSKTSNGITVASQIMHSPIASISVFIKCGSRNETQQTSGVAHFLEHLHFKGTKNRTRLRIQQGVQQIGGSLNAYTSRENTSYMMTVFKKDLPVAVQILGDMLTKSLYRSQDVENERSTIHRELIETRKTQPLETTIEIGHRGIFKEQQIGLPILGDISNMQTITRDMIVKYHRDNYVGQNIIIVGSGDINHSELVEAVEKNFAVPQKSTTKVELVKPQFCEGMSLLQSNHTNLLNMIVVHEAPSFFDRSFLVYLILQRIVSDRPANPFQLEILKNSNNFRYQKHLANHQFIQEQKGFYSAYWDTGLYGSYFLIDGKNVKEVIQLDAQCYSNYSNKITDQQLQRAKRKVYNEILHHQTQNDITQSIANNLMYYGRRVHSKQLAERVASVTSEDLQQVCKKIVKNYKVDLSLSRKFTPAFGVLFLNLFMNDLYRFCQLFFNIVLFYLY